MGTPLTHFWIAEYNDGMAVPQFDPEDGHENKFTSLDQGKMVAFGIYPFSRDFADFVTKTNGSTVATFGGEGKVRIDVKDGKKVMYKRLCGIPWNVFTSEQGPEKVMSYVLGLEGGPFLFLKSDGFVTMDWDFNKVV